MKRPRKPGKPRNMIAKAMHESKLFKPKVVPVKKGKGLIYNRKDAKGRGDHLGPYSLSTSQTPILNNAAMY